MSKPKSNAGSTQTIKNLALYHYQSCPFCGITREVIKYMEGLKIEQRDILSVPEYRKELIQGGGKPQVPCLKIETNNGAIEWLYESRDIIQYLKRHDAALSAAA
jgi:glutaredoxin 2